MRPNRERPTTLWITGFLAVILFLMVCGWLEELDRNLNHPQGALHASTRRVGT